MKVFNSKGQVIQLREARGKASFPPRNIVHRAIRGLLRLHEKDDAALRGKEVKDRKIPGKPWTWAFWELPNARKTEPGRQVIRRALAQTAYKRLKGKYGGMSRDAIRPLALALAKKTFRETPKERLLEMYREAEKTGRIA